MKGSTCESNQQNLKNEYCNNYNDKKFISCYSTKNVDFFMIFSAINEIKNLKHDKGVEDKC